MLKKCYICIVSFLTLVTVAHADVSQFVFTTDPQSIPLSTLSGPITIQSQNNTGAQESVVETTDLVFTSTSGSGKFLNSSGNAVSTTMSKNTANRTFYYSDSTAGVYTLSVTATGRDTKKSFATSQQITVGGGGGATNQNTSTTTASGGASTSGGTVSSTDSAHSSPVGLSSSQEKLDFEISSGRDRFTSVGNEQVMEAKITKVGTVPSESVQYTWSFGDGTQAIGKTVAHRYRFPGQYNVLLNAVYSDAQAVSRAKVTVIVPRISMEIVDGGVRIINTSAGEINLGDWHIRSDFSDVTIPKDTIIQADDSVVFPNQTTHVSGSHVSLVDPLNTDIAHVAIVVPVVPIATTSNSVVVVQATTTAPIAQMQILPKKKSIQTVSNTFATLATPVSKPATSTDMTATVYEATTETSALDSLFAMPAKGLGWIRGLFRR